jgi:epoxyqueuosine reductase
MKFDDGCLKEHGIEYAAAVPFEACGIINERRLGVLKKRLSPASVIVFLVPYYAGEEKRNISKYAVSRDYHVFMRGLFDTVCPVMSEKYGADFCGMADSAPINEVKAAVYAGLGMQGDNGMLINEKYGSYVFIGALYTDAVFEYDGDKTSYCPHCGKCRAACPMKDGRQCLSAVTQKKGELTDAEISYIRQFGSAWGCDICADACPYSKKAAKTPIRFFYEDRTPYLTPEVLSGMTDEQFSERAYAWRGKAVIERNLGLLQNKDGKNENGTL